MQRWIIWFAIGPAIGLLLVTALHGSAMETAMSALLTLWIGLNILFVPVFIWKVIIRFIAREWYSQAPRNR